MTQPSVTPVSLDPLPFSGLCRHKVHVWNTDIYIHTNTHTHKINTIFLIKYLPGETKISYVDIIAIFISVIFFRILTRN